MAIKSLVVTRFRREPLESLESLESLTGFSVRLESPGHRHAGAIRVETRN
jgi:hypothetical protein